MGGWEDTLKGVDPERSLARRLDRTKARLPSLPIAESPDCARYFIPRREERAFR